MEGNMPVSRKNANVSIRRKCRGRRPEGKKLIN